MCTHMWRSKYILCWRFKCPYLKVSEQLECAGSGACQEVDTFTVESLHAKRAVHVESIL